MRRWPDVAESLQRFFPQPVQATAHAYVVGNGHGWGDAYVRDGVMLLNAVLIAAQYQGAASEQAAGALGVLRHETFHVLFDAYRKTAPQWRVWPTDALSKLKMIVLDEGLGHYADREHELDANGFPPERAGASIARLADVASTIAQADEQQAAALLQEAHQGKYWNKFGAIGGMFFVHAVAKHNGVSALHDAVRCGPGELIAAYVRATEEDEQLPALPTSLRSWAPESLCDADASSETAITS